MTAYSHLTNRELERYLDDVQEQAVVDELRQRVRHGRVRFVDPTEVRKLAKEIEACQDLDEFQSVADDLRHLVN